MGELGSLTTLVEVVRGWCSVAPVREEELGVVGAGGMVVCVEVVVGELDPWLADTGAVVEETGLGMPGIVGVAIFPS